MLICLTGMWLYKICLFPYLERTANQQNSARLKTVREYEQFSD